MPNSGYKQDYVQAFYCKYISFLKAVNMFERMEIAGSINKGIVEPSYKTLPVNIPTIMVTEVIL